MEEAVHDLFSKAFDDKGKLNFENKMYKIAVAGWPRWECQSDIVVVADAKDNDGDLVC